jgi:hypothetical protein
VKTERSRRPYYGCEVVVRARVALVGLVSSLVLASPALAQYEEPPPGGGMTVNVGNASVTEGNTGAVSATFAVTLSQASSSAVSVDYAAPPPVQPVGDATANADYQATSGRVTIPAGSMSATIVVPVYGDTAAEPNEIFYVHLSNPAGAAVGSHHGAGTIVNDDGGVAADTRPPNTFIHGGPGRVTRSRTASFHLASTEAGSRFQCKLDARPWRACRARLTLRRLARGVHTLRVRAIDRAGNVDRTPARRTWRIR